jgi:integrase
MQMPKPIRIYKEQMSEYLRDLEVRGASKEYRQDVRMHLLNAADLLEQQGMMTRPERMTQEHMAIVRDNTGGSIVWKKARTGALWRFMKFCGNYQRNFHWPQVEHHRQRVTWEDWDTALEGCWEAGDIRAATILILESLTIRGIGVLRMKPDDIDQDCVWALDKGRMGGKRRKIPITQQTYFQLRQYLDWRRQEIQRILQNNPSAAMPDSLIIWTRKNTMGNVRNRNTIEDIVKAAGRRVGVKLNSHAIRRMACRELYKQVKASKNTENPFTLQEAMQISGHEKEQDFLIYVGSVEDGSRQLMEAMMQNRNAQKKAQTIIAR